MGANFFYKVKIHKLINHFRIQPCFLKFINDPQILVEYSTCQSLTLHHATIAASILIQKAASEPKTILVEVLLILHLSL